MLRRFRHIVVLTALVSAVIGLSAAPARAARGMEIALQDDSTLVAGFGMKPTAALKLADQLFVSRLRVNVPWSAVVNSPAKRTRPKKRRYDFASYDLLLNRARRHGIKLQLTLMGYAPAWATGNKQIGCYKVNVKYFKEYVRATVKHFRRNVDRYAVWNEPNLESWNAPLRGAASRYRSLYTTAYREIRSIDRGAQVLIGETAPFGQSERSISPLKFLRDVVKSGPLKADGFAHHPYDFRHPVDYRYPGSDNVTISTLGRLTGQLAKLAKSGRLRTPAGGQLPVYLTEYGYMASGRYKVSESKRAKYVTKAFQIALDNPRVKQMLQYLLVKPPDRTAFFDTSIVSKKGKKSTTFKALASWAKKQAGKRRIALRTPPRR
jgi:GH35 family endo-1,4-beta-xylanase